MKNIILILIGFVFIISCSKDETEKETFPPSLVEDIHINIFTRTYATSFQKVYVNNELIDTGSFISSYNKNFQVQTGDSLRIEVTSDELIGNQLASGNLGTEISTSLDGEYFELDIDKPFIYTGTNLYPYEYEIDYSFTVRVPFKN